MPEKYLAMRVHIKKSCNTAICEVNLFYLMRITNLHVENFLTFNSLDLKFQKNPTIFIGPNGSGKTNIIRVLEFVDSTLWHRNLVPQSVGYFKITLKLVLSKKE